MLDASAATQPKDQSQASTLGSQHPMPSKPSPPRLERGQDPDWSKYFWATLEVGLPQVHLLRNPYFPETETSKGGWREIVERAFRPERGRVEGVTDRRGNYVMTPQTAMNQHAVDIANRLLKEPPKHFTGPLAQTFFCFLDMSYSQMPDWAVIHREAGDVCLRDDLLLIRPNGEVTMEATVVGPVFQLHGKEIRLWEAVAVELNRAFIVVDMENADSSDS